VSSLRVVYSLHVFSVFSSTVTSSVLSW
jgi:hypothetical protein